MEHRKEKVESWPARRGEETEDTPVRKKWLRHERKTLRGETGGQRRPAMLGDVVGGKKKGVEEQGRKGKGKAQRLMRIYVLSGSVL